MTAHLVGERLLATRFAPVVDHVDGSSSAVLP